MDRVAEEGHLNGILPENVKKRIALPAKSNKKFTYRFDFEIGYLVQSPCRSCGGRQRLPGCAEGCAVLAEIRSILAESVSCTRHF